MKRICLIEPAFHCEVLTSLCRLLLLLDYELTVFTHRAVFDEVQDLLPDQTKLAWQLFEEGTEGSTSFLTKIHPLLGESDLVFLLTVIRKFRFWATYDFPCPLIVVVHNGNTWFNPGQNLWMRRHLDSSFLFDLIRLIRERFRNYPYHRERLLIRSAGIGVLSGELRSYLQDRVAHEMTKKIIVLSSPCFDALPPASIVQGNEVMISIPGAVTDNGRDYDLVCAGIQDALPEFQYPVHLVLLGVIKGAAAKKIVRQFKGMEGRNFRVTTFEMYIPQKVFDEYLKRSHFLLLPFKKERKFSLYREKVGFSSISGTINDLIRFGLPALISRHYPLDQSLRLLTAPFAGKRELSALLISWVNDRIYAKKREASHELKKQLGEKHIANQLRKVMEGIVDHY